MTTSRPTLWDDLGDVMLPLAPMPAGFVPHPAPTFEVVVAGTPAGQGNHRVNAYGAMYETSKGLPEWRKAMKNRCEFAMSLLPVGIFPIVGEVAASIVWTFACPPNRDPSTSPALDRSVPDIDHLQRAVFDALSVNRPRRKKKGDPEPRPRGAGVIKDDSLVAEIWEPTKTVYVGHPLALGRPGAHIRVWSLA